MAVAELYSTSPRGARHGAAGAGAERGAATFVREAKALLVRSGQPVPKALQNGRELAKML